MRQNRLCSVVQNRTCKVLLLLGVYHRRTEPDFLFWLGCKKSNVGKKQKAGSGISICGDTQNPTRWGLRTKLWSRPSKTSEMF